MTQGSLVCREVLRPGDDSSRRAACRLIVNADDFGASEGVNEAVMRLADDGIVTSTSLMVSGAAALDAVQIVRDRPYLAVGLHLALVDAAPVLPPDEIPLLLGAGGDRLRADFRVAGIRYSLSPARQAQLRAEAEAQFKAFAGLGLPWSHVDCHLHFSLTPAVFRIAVDLATRYEVPAFRIPQDDFALYRSMDSLDAGRQRWLAFWFDAFCKRQRRLLDLTQLRTTRYCYGLFRTGRLDEEYLVRLIARLPDGELELHCHPDLSTPAGRTEFEALRSRRVRRALEQRGAELATYSSLG
jgi:hopanoid biosynthesis associated protein HpnK